MASYTDKETAPVADDTDAEKFAVLEVPRLARAAKDPSSRPRQGFSTKCTSSSLLKQPGLEAETFAAEGRDPDGRRTSGSRWTQDTVRTAASLNPIDPKP